MTMCFFHGRPKKYALLCALRLLPSMTYSSCSGNFRLLARDSTPSFSLPSCRGDSLLKSGRMAMG